jgi:hypothetical protein
MFLWQVNQKDDPNTDSQHHALEPEYGGGGRSLRSIGTGGGGECFFYQIRAYCLWSDPLLWSVLIQFLSFRMHANFKIVEFV